MAQEKIIAPSPRSSVTLDLYEQPGAAHAVRQIKTIEAGLPLTIQSKEAGFYKVLIGGKDYWVRGVKVRISRDTTANCGEVSLSSSVQSASSPGAGKYACK